MPAEIALFCLLYPASAEKRERVLSLLQNQIPYYRSPSSLCMTWTYFTPSNRPGAVSQPLGSSVPDDSSPTTSARNLILAGMEIYTDKSALSTQLQDPGFKAYHATVKEEDLYARPEELVVWYRVAGFIARAAAAADTAPPPHGKGTIVMVAKFICKDGCRDMVLEVFGPFTEFVRNNEPDVLTYSALTRPKAPNEILIFERYKNLDALKSHGSSKEFRAMFKSIKPHLQNTIMSEFEEIDGSFVGNVLGGGGGGAMGSSSKL